MYARAMPADANVGAPRTLRIEALPGHADLSGRPIRMGDNPKGGQWRVIAQAGPGEIVIWGRLDAVTKAPKYFEILRTFTPKAGAPKGLGAQLSR